MNPAPASIPAYDIDTQICFCADGVGPYEISLVSDGIDRARLNVRWQECGEEHGFEQPYRVHLDESGIRIEPTREVGVEGAPLALVRWGRNATTEEIAAAERSCNITQVLVDTTPQIASHYAYGLLEQWRVASLATESGQAHAAIEQLWLRCFDAMIALADTDPDASLPFQLPASGPGTSGGRF